MESIVSHHELLRALNCLSRNDLSFSQSVVPKRFESLLTKNENPMKDPGCSTKMIDV